MNMTEGYMYQDRQEAQKERDKQEKRTDLHRRLAEVVARHRLTFDCLEMVDPIYGHSLRVEEDLSGGLVASIVLICDRETSDVRDAVQQLTEEMHEDEANGEELWFSIRFHVEPKPVRP